MKHEYMLDSKPQPNIDDNELLVDEWYSDEEVIQGAIVLLDYIIFGR